MTEKQAKSAQARYDEFRKRNAACCDSLPRHFSPSELTKIRPDWKPLREKAGYTPARPFAASEGSGQFFCQQCGVLWYLCWDGREGEYSEIHTLPPVFWRFYEVQPDYDLLIDFLADPDYEFCKSAHHKVAEYQIAQLSGSPVEDRFYRLNVRAEDPALSIEAATNLIWLFRRCLSEIQIQKVELARALSLEKIIERGIGLIAQRDPQTVTQGDTYNLSLFNLLHFLEEANLPLTPASNEAKARFLGSSVLRTAELNVFRHYVERKCIKSADYFKASVQRLISCLPYGQKLRRDEAEVLEKFFLEVSARISARREEFQYATLPDFELQLFAPHVEMLRKLAEGQLVEESAREVLRRISMGAEVA